MKLNEYIEITNEDNMELMARYPDKYFDLAIVDPPYGIGVGSMAYTNGVSIIGKTGKAKRGNYFKENDWDNKPPEKEYFNELFRISKNQIIWGGNYFADKIPVSKGFIVWDKRIEDKMSNDFADCELAWCSRGVARMFRYMWNGMLQGNMKNKEKRIHPTQKPVALYEWLLNNYAKKGDKILDTHFGSGSIACAVHDANIIDKMNLSLVACELDKDYFERSIQRVKAALRTQSLF